jgi:hypothetical protein
MEGSPQPSLGVMRLPFGISGQRVVAGQLHSNPIPAPAASINIVCTGTGGYLRVARKKQETPQMKVARIIRESGLTRARIADDSRIPDATLGSWLAGRRNPTPESLDLLADGLVARARKLLELARQLKNGD